MNVLQRLPRALKIIMNTIHAHALQVEVLRSSPPALELLRLQKQLLDLQQREVEALEAQVGGWAVLVRGCHQATGA